MSDSRCSNFVLLITAALFQAATLGLVQAAPLATPDPPIAPGEQQAQGATQGTKRPARLAVIAKPSLDRTGKKRFGKASFYAHMFEGRKMANGNRMNPQQDNAASRTLPLGTTAKVTNLETGKSALVTIQDRGPYVGGRIVDLSPATARQIGITPRKGVAQVEVSPIAVPLQNGGIKLGDAAPLRLASNRNYPVFPPVGW
jgi:peptidoglycan lytic transglycosylase